MTEPHLVVVYDVTEDRRRTRVHRILHERLRHVQKSVFEGPIREDAVVSITERVGAAIDRSTDTVRIYRLCARCRCATEIVGTGSFVEEPGDVVM